MKEDTDKRSRSRSKEGRRDKDQNSKRDDTTMKEGDKRSRSEEGRKDRDQHNERDDTAPKKRKERKLNSYGGKKKRRSVKEGKQHPDWRRGSEEGGEPNERNTIPHIGSYASPKMRELFDVSLPEENDKRLGGKRKVALFIGYLGTEYNGFQINENQRTIQSEVELALYRAGLLQQSNFGFPHKYAWSTSGRTDKGVHACSQVCSLKLEIGTEHCDTADVEYFRTTIKDRINEHLPDDIVILDVVRTTRNFSAKTSRSLVRYQYMIPSYIFKPNFKKLVKKELEEKDDRPNSDPLAPEEVKKLRKKLRKYRITPDQLELLRSALQTYDGTKAYHNFTRSMDPGDKASSRYIVEFKADAPVIREDGTEWIPTRVLGQAFLMNQIRKMIALACDVVNFNDIATIDGTMEAALSRHNPIRMILPIAPAEGLFLDMSVYSHYNERKNRGSASKDLIEDLDWINQPSSKVMKKWKDFKESVVQQKIIDQEAEEGNFIIYRYQQTFVFMEKHEYDIPPPSDATKKIKDDNTPSKEKETKTDSKK
eukprot:CAMPEP_0194148202 /NCGR_PEP_ID=MMETSP0152-20130528/30766_1 /TAXON_ID=1049557 /ORGANISM="Thalassiothrix antarctica, Strain L6-D1" /LENGTH=537 /DNA_ID=CAMNT_0038849567 /DNA_START=239 /DNA_END=1852 /DNA_ORIENTATION=+